MARLDKELATESRCEQMVPVWIKRMRDVAQKHLTQDVVDSIVKNQIEAAKRGDRNAINFVFNQLMGGQALKGATFIQNNYGEEFSDSPNKPTKALPGSNKKLKTMQQRADAGLPLCQEEDGPEVDLS